MIVYKELSSLCKDLGFSPRAVYAASNYRYKHYQPKSIVKENGEIRQLWVPDNSLKSIQSAIATKLLVYEPVSKYATAYTLGSSTLKNAMPHVGQPCMLKLDIRKFFDSLYYCLIKDKVFPAEKYSENNRILLTLLCIYKDVLPQGAPTSPVISNIIMCDFDCTVGAWCESRNINYTRYCDDMTFSGNFAASDVKSFVSAELRKMGLYLNNSKSVFVNQGQRMSVTGITVNGKLSASRDYLKQIRQEMYYCQKFGIQSHLLHTASELSQETYISKLLGRVNYAFSIDKGNLELLEYKKWLVDNNRT